MSEVLRSSILHTSTVVCSSSLFSNLKCVDNPTLIIIMKMSRKFQINVALTFIKLMKNANQTGMCSVFVIIYGTLFLTSSMNGSLSLRQFIAKWTTEASLIECSTETRSKYKSLIFSFSCSFEETWQKNHLMQPIKLLLLWVEFYMWTSFSVFEYKAAIYSLQPFASDALARAIWMLRLRSKRIPWHSMNSIECMLDIEERIDW